jgi:nicotinamide mononucleotide adenylyltransferase
MNKPFNCFIGRYQCPHKGHQTIFSKYLSKDEPILIMIRDVPTDEKNPFTPQEVLDLWSKVYEKEVNEGLVKIIIIPDIASVNYGRGVGYNVVEIKVDTNISNISATEIRTKIRNGDDSWKEFVSESIQEKLSNLLTSK